MNIHAGAIPDAEPSDIIAWAEENIKVDGHSFDSTRTPQLVEPIRAMFDHGTRIGTYVKPVQSGGSTAGEIVLGGWSRFRAGKIQMNWQHDGKAKERWKDRILPALESVAGLRWAGGFDKTVCEARFVNATVIVQGVVSDGALDSETIPLQLNEEIHLWDKGTLDKARSRQTLVWNAKAFDISNASCVGDQLHAAYEEGTMEVWEVLCPGCKQHHEIRFRWDDKKPELGGLRFDTSAGRMPNGGYSLNKVVPTIRYQMPCGYLVRDLPTERRALIGRYRRTNEGALDEKRSWNYEGVSVAEIKWPDLVSEWLKAIKAMKAGDIAPLKNFVQRRECKFWGDDSIPFYGQILVSPGIMKQREGMKNRAARLWKADWQQGYKSKGQLEHFWLVIKDVDHECNDLLVFEGRCDSEKELLATLIEHDALENGAGVIDCSFNTKHLQNFVYKTCKEYRDNGKTIGMHCMMSNNSRLGGFTHGPGVRRHYDIGTALCTHLNVESLYPPVQTDDGYAPGEGEPIVLQVHKGGMIANHFFVREHKQRVLAAAKEKGVEADASEYIECVIPEDVSEEFLRQYGSWRRSNAGQKKTMDEVSSGAEKFTQIIRDDHLLICCAGIDTLKDWCGMLGDRLAKMGIRTEETK